ncbi:DNA-binding CsgD family transcriptional regulator [Mycolicibacterium iranicum]|uniref:DNA-binding CsgD family transcriptional regulator n=1 Tax=Mycolicibacterium iranicum TaxID=912594 RepID=A0A839Q9I3_MYCIR|nr:AAA family ATPase [Mycolicibacterium iranicum]MBB2992193.1 DNA-binding CsgD family transcriptional regulator [Mycolicibacterium iranicum]
MELIGRTAELSALRAVLTAVREGRSGALVLCGEAGIGKTALLDELARQAPDCRVVRIAGVESEMDFAHAGLHQLCTALPEGMADIPAPQSDALLTALGRRAGATPDPFLVGLAVLGLMSETAHRDPLLLLIDDYQWLDRASRRAMAFAARRLGRESAGVVFASRTVGEDLRGLPELAVGALRENDAHMLLTRSVDGPLDARVRDRIVAEARGNPLALLELPRALGRGGLEGGFGTPGAPATHSLEGSIRTQLTALPPATRRLLALAAADPVGDPTLLWRAADLLGLGAVEVVPAVEAGLAEIGSRVAFRHPLIRSTAYRSVPLSDRQSIHGALAAVTSVDHDPDRRAWHLGHAALGPDESVADELERSADRVRARGGMTAAGAFLQRAAELTVDPSRRCDRALAAAAIRAQAGTLDAARDLLRVADACAHTELQRARADLVRAQLAFLSSHGNTAGPLLLAAARRLETVDPALARETYLDAMSAALFAGRLAVDATLLEVSKAAVAVPRGPAPASPSDLLLDGLARQHCDGFTAGLPVLRDALQQWGRGMPFEHELRWMLLACFASTRVWDIDRHASLSVRYLQLVRDAGAVSHLPLALSSRFLPLLYAGNFVEAAQVCEEMREAIDAMGQNVSPYSAVVLAAWRGRADELAQIADAAGEDAVRRGEGHGITVIAWARAVLANAVGDYADAHTAALDASSYPGDGGASWWALPELVEAASRLGDEATAAAAHNRLAEVTTPSGTDWALGHQARCRALVTAGDAAEPHYRDAIARSTRAGLRPDAARSRLLYGEWLRRRRRRVDARTELRAALASFESIGMEAFAERARRELRATGETARRRIDTPAGTLTAREAQIARLAAEGLSNPEIGARLFISARTVQFHLGKVFAKLGIRSRSQLESIHLGAAT